MDKLRLTSVKILKSIHLKFKRQCLNDEFTLQKFVNRALDLYNTDTKFKEQIKEYTKLEESGSMI
ncbi:MAG: hypothetical protein H8E03_01020 [Pelagibacteraceae bacterium]|nr:hypothetical protein [Pelagibacteraceae bacterium]